MLPSSVVLLVFRHPAQMGAGVYQVPDSERSYFVTNAGNRTLIRGPGHETDGDTEITRRRAKSPAERKWPHHVALPAEKVRGLKNSEVTFDVADAGRAANVLSAAR
jgi:hypothetical protein